MPKTEKIICDQCGADLTSTGNSVDWRISVRSEQIPPRVGTVTYVVITPSLDQDAYFCNAECLVDWVKKKYRTAEEKLEDLKVAPGGNASTVPLVDGTATRLIEKDDDCGDRHCGC